MTGSVEKIIEDYGKKIDPLLEQEFPPGLYPYLSEGARYQLYSGGKRLRPALCLLTCEGLGGDVEKALYFACASEILHNLFLIHDDIEDGDRKRRNRDTLWVKFGIPNAINVGDFLTAKAYQVLLKSPVTETTLLKLLRIFTDTYLTTTRGQALDINLRANSDLTLAKYVEIVSLKTARYLAYNMVGGAAVAGADEKIQNKLWELGGFLGPAFQIQDDVLDLTLGKGRAGEIGCDIAEGKPTIFLAYLMDSYKAGKIALEEVTVKKLLGILAKKREETTPEEINWVIRLYEETGAIQVAKEHATSLIKKAQDTLSQIPLSNREVFAELCRFMVERNR